MRNIIKPSEFQERNVYCNYREPDKQSPNMRISRNMIDKYCGFDWREVISLLAIVLAFCIMAALAWILVLLGE